VRSLLNIIKVVLLTVFVFFTACAQIPEEKPPELYWPLPPERPRIKFVDLVLGSIDVTGVKSGKFKQLLFGEEGEVRFVKPLFVAVKNNVMYVTDVIGIHVYDYNKKEFMILGSGLLRNPTGIDVASDGRIFVGDSAIRQVFIFNPSPRRVTMVAKPGTFGSLGGIAVDEPRGRFIVVDAKKHRVSVYSLDGKFLFSFGKRGINPGEFNFPYDVAVDAEGRMYVVDSGNFRVQIFDKEGKFLRAFGKVGTFPGFFARPKGIALDSEGHIYVVDAAFGNFQIFDSKGVVLLSVGANGSEPGKFSLPVGIDIDENDRIYVVDQMNQRVQILQYLKYPDEK